jgi:hypothetical protein
MTLLKSRVQEEEGKRTIAAVEDLAEWAYLAAVPLVEILRVDFREDDFRVPVIQAAVKVVVQADQAADFRPDVVFHLADLQEMALGMDQVAVKVEVQVMDPMLVREVVQAAVQVEAGAVVLVA